MKYIINRDKYLQFIRNLANIIDRYDGNDPTDMLIELAQVKSDYASQHYEVYESLAQRIAVANVCDMALIQFRDSNGELDYAGLGNYSERILRNIISNINLYGCEP